MSYYLQEKDLQEIIIKLSKVIDKERILKAAKVKKKVIYKRTPVRPSADFSTETLQAKKECNNILKVLKDKNCQPRILYLAMLSFRYEGKIKALPDKS